MERRNVSARCFRPVTDNTPQFDELSRRLPPELLEFEITESTLMDNLDATIDILNALKVLGVRISIDDFGTGYSSLALLKQLPVDTLKIDRCFVKDIGEDEEDRQIIQAVIAMSAQLQLEVIAEGVETQAQSDLLYAFGCRRVQGYFYGKPVIGVIPDTPRTPQPVVEAARPQGARQFAPCCVAALGKSPTITCERRLAGHELAGSISTH
ncbi:EAL domain-containing protein [Marinobacterium sedimentorum]|uniref:EAL domain-containing protein n=1 Tax=Marinobacterium sedimentorum TaxID=2927804 RepID=UPI0020C64C17|nr:EAL domain-containing protein [Marinobacterium sedimentorum]MCP8686663.1 EAL domain-containing protein [Marinobacterium sedimentorum]